MRTFRGNFRSTSSWAFFSRFYCHSSFLCFCFFPFPRPPPAKRKNSINLILFVSNEICNSNSASLGGKIVEIVEALSFRSPSLTSNANLPSTRKKRENCCNYIWSWATSNFSSVSSGQAIRFHTPSFRSNHSDLTRCGMERFWFDTLLQNRREHFSSHIGATRLVWNEFISGGLHESRGNVWECCEVGTCRWSVEANLVSFINKIGSTTSDAVMFALWIFQEIFLLLPRLRSQTH